MTVKRSPPDPAILNSFDVTAPTLVAESSFAAVWKVRQADGTAAALKIYDGVAMEDEAPGFDLIEALQGQGAVRLFRRTNRAILMEWLDGPPLSDLVRAGQDDEACRVLAATANRLHRSDARHITALVPLADRFHTLFDAQFSVDCPQRAVAVLREATAIAQRCLTTQGQACPLHGDLHHDNVKDSDRGYVMFDAKGTFGDRHYDLANAFRNPLGSENFTHKPETILRRAALWADDFATDPGVLLRWAAAHGALSLAWTCNGTFDSRVIADIPYLETLLNILDGP